MPLSERFSGWNLVAVLGAAIVAASWIDFSAYGDAIDGLRSAARLTADISLVLFGLAFSASSALRLRRNGVTVWLTQNRRSMGLSFAFSHLVHLGVVVAIAFVNPAHFAAHTNIVTYVGGGLGYVLIAAMAATSFDRSAAWLGPKWWRRLHVFGSYYIWFIFASNSVGLTIQHLSHCPFAAFILGAMAVRIAGKRFVTGGRGQLVSNGL
jgi:DMSO/TMAO reductase YedYZ heme-binding membrane subunit